MQIFNSRVLIPVLQELSSGLSAYIALNSNGTYGAANNNNLFALHSLPQLHESLAKESTGSHHMIVTGLLLPINVRYIHRTLKYSNNVVTLQAVNAKIGLKLTNPKTVVLHASLESKLSNNNKRGPKISYSTAEERMSLEEEDRKVCKTEFQIWSRARTNRLCHSSNRLSVQPL